LQSKERRKSVKLDRVIAVRNNKTVFRDGKRCVKIFSPDFPKTRVFAEALNHARIEVHVDFVPMIQEVIRHDRNWAIVYDFVRGKTLLQWMEEEPEAFSLQAEYFADVQIRLHGKKAPSLGSMKEAFSQAIRQGPLDFDLKEALLAGLEKMKFSSEICHLDFVPSNIIITEDGAPMVIDWGSALSGSPLADVSGTYLLMKIRAREAFAEEYLGFYLSKTKKERGHLEEWFPYTAAFLMNFANRAEREALLPYVKMIENKGETK
jgi:serine/threonine protein kinase